MLFWFLIILGVVVLIAIGIIISYYNKIIVLSNRIDNAWSQIDVQLKKRFDLVPNLVKTVKAYMKHEKETFAEITKARSIMTKAGFWPKPLFQPKPAF